MEIHVVRAGETLYTIAQSYSVDETILREANGVPPGGALAVGQTLVIQHPQTLHIVQPGQNLFGIARLYNLPLRQLYRNNYFLHGLPGLREGQVLVIAWADSPEGEIDTNGYAYPFISRRELSSTLPYMSYLTPFTYGIDAQGSLLPLEDGMLLEEAGRLGAAPMMHLSSLTEDDNFSSERAVWVLTRPELQAALIEQILSTIRAKGYRGLDVDFEYIPPAQREDYTAFIQALRDRLAPLGLPVVVALAPKTYAAQPGLLYEAHDYAALGAAADYLLLMTYEWGYAYSEPMAVAPIPNVRKVVEYALTEIPARKLYLGIPNYGYDWPLPYEKGKTRARSISNQEAVELAVAHRAEIQYDETAQSPYFQYTAPDGAAHEVWFEDARSMAVKLRLIKEYGLYGAGYWNLMRPYPQGWTLLNAIYDIRRER